MNSEEESFREIYSFPEPELKIDKAKRRHRRKKSTQQTDQKVQSFDKFVRKTKNVVLFAQKLKQQIGRTHIFDMHTLTSKELQYLENQSSQPAFTTCFDSQNKFVMGIQITLLMVLLLYAWKCSFEISFRPDGALRPINYFAIFMLLGQIIVFCLTQYKNEMEENITECRLIWQIYIKDKFAKDLLTILLVVIQTSGIDSYIIQTAFPTIIRLITIYLLIERIKQSARKVQYAFSLSTNTQTIVAMLKLLSQIFLLLHFVSIVLNLMAKIQNYLGCHNTWLSVQQFDADSDLQKYVAAFYWGATILSSVGFGDMIPANHIERFFISILQILCCMSFGYFVNVIGSLIRLQTQRDEKYQKEKRSLNRYLSTLKLTHELKLKIRGNFLNRHKVEKTLDSCSQQTVLQNLNPKLKNSLLAENNINIIKKSNKFERLTGQTLTKLAQILKRVIFAPEHIIYSNATEQTKLWLIESGSVDQYTNNFKNCVFEKRIAEYNQNDPAVGWINFICQNKYTSSAKASKMTVAYELDEPKFRAILQQNPKDYYKILQMKQLLIESKKKYVQKCLSCDRYTHNVINCPRIHFIRSDVTSMVLQGKRMDKYKLSLKKKKYKRQYIRQNWKKTFQEDQIVGKADIIRGKKQERSTLNMKIESFLKNLTKLQSQRNISSKKIGSVKRQQSISSRYDEIQNCLKSNGSMPSEMSEAEIYEIVLDQPFEEVMLDKDNKQYLPHHNIEQIIKEYNNNSRTKSVKDIPHKLFNFNKKKK